MWSFYKKLMKNKVWFLLGKWAALSNLISIFYVNPDNSPNSFMENMGSYGSYVVYYLVSFTYLLEYLNKPFSNFNLFIFILLDNKSKLWQIAQKLVGINLILAYC